MKKFILIGHRKRVGKDTFAHFVKEAIGDNAEIMSFATPLKEIVAEMLGISMERLDVLKNDPNSPVRSMLIAFGNGKIKEYFGKNVWSKLLVKKAAEVDADWIIVPDFRFPEEYIEGATTIRVDRDLIKCDGNEADVALSNYAFDALVHNNYGLDDLKDTAEFLVHDYLNIPKPVDHKKNMEYVYGTDKSAAEEVEEVNEEIEKVQNGDPVGRTEVGKDLDFSELIKAIKDALSSDSDSKSGNGRYSVSIEINRT